MGEPNQEMAGRLEAIWIKRVRRGPMDPKESVRAVAGRGLEGNADQGRKRQVTLLAAEAWEQALVELGQTIEPWKRRANLYVRGIDLAASRGRVLCVGPIKIRIYGETVPCRLMDEISPGLKAALKPDWRGGVFGQVLDDGQISVGDRVLWQS